MVMALVRGMASETSTSKFGGPTSLWSFWHKPRPCAFCFTKKHGNIFKTKTQYLFVKLVLVLKKKNQLSIWTPPRDYRLGGAPHVSTGGLKKSRQTDRVCFWKFLHRTHADNSFVF